MVREDNLVEIAENIERNLEEDVKSSASKEEEIPPEEEDNLNQSSGKDEEMYLWDKLEYKANYIHSISNKSTEKQVRIASAVVNKLEEAVYDYRTRIEERSRPFRKHNDNQPISVFWEIGRTKAHCLIDSGCEGIMLSPNFIRAAKIEPFPLNKPTGIQLAVTDSKSVINYGMNATIKYEGKESKRIFRYYQHRLL